ncbi:MAG: transcriptional repressor [Oscillatoriales cyanobacterium SM2_2_1]|nr:transcriptional repressor [Oscillatoriales cyanobacterium SM2_2_1]
MLPTSSPLQISTSLEHALKRCQDLGMRVSRQRRFILELLWETGEHLSAREIYDRLNHLGKPIGHTSVYQNLEALAANGIVECVEQSGGRLYGSVSEPHSHVHCLDTMEILDIQITLPQEVIDRVSRETGVDISHYRIEFYGQRHDSPQAKVSPLSRV